ncbi:MAG TPA: hypothetical protein VE862_06405 [Candidatus Acidoferrum sp.]|nr:hypothetical protein [Candidatus Acidoferrum sp.]
MSQPRVGMPSLRTLALLVVLVLVVLFSFVAFPLSPTLRASFRITTPPQSPPTMEIVDASYSKTSLLTSASSNLGNITVSYLQGTQGYYSLTIVITYGGTVLSSGSYSSLGDGLYEMSVAYFPRTGEQTATPYSVTFSLSYSNGIAIGDLTLPIYPA